MKKGWKKAVISMCCLVGVISFAQQAHATSGTQYDYIVTEAQYGVNPNDKVSDAKGIQSVLDKAIGSASMVKIYFPAGTYYIDSTLKVYSNTHIILHEDAVVYRMDSLVDKMLIHNVDQNGKMDAIGGYGMSSNIILEGGTWDGGNKEIATDATNVVRFDHAENVIVKNCTIKNTYDCHILELVGVKNASVTGCTFTGFRYQKGKTKDYTYAREAIQIETAWTDNEKDLTDSSVHWANGTVIDGTACKNVTISDNTFIDTPCGVGQHHYTDNGKYRSEDVTISNNVFDCAESLKYCKTAITAMGMNNLTIKVTIQHPRCGCNNYW